MSNQHALNEYEFIWNRLKVPKGQVEGFFNLSGLGIDALEFIMNDTAVLYPMTEFRPFVYNKKLTPNLDVINLFAPSNVLKYVYNNLNRPNGMDRLKSLLVDGALRICAIPGCGLKDLEMLYDSKDGKEKFKILTEEQCCIIDGRAKYTFLCEVLGNLFPYKQPNQWSLEKLQALASTDARDLLYFKNVSIENLLKLYEKLGAPIRFLKAIEFLNSKNADEIASILSPIETILKRIGHIVDGGVKDAVDLAGGAVIAFVPKGEKFSNAPLVESQGWSKIDSHGAVFMKKPSLPLHASSRKVPQGGVARVQDEERSYRFLKAHDERQSTKTRNNLLAGIVNSKGSPRLASGLQ